MYPQPNEHGVYDAEYEIPVRLSKKKAFNKCGVMIELCQIGERKWAAGFDMRFNESGYGVPTKGDAHSSDWDIAAKKAALDVRGRIKPGTPEADDAISLINEFMAALPNLRIEDFKIPQEATMAKKKPEPAQAQPVEEKFYLHKFSKTLSIPMAISKPVTYYARKVISEEIDAGYLFELIDEQFFQILRLPSSADRTWPQPTDEKHAEVCKLIDYEPLIKKVVACTKMFEQQFTPDEIKQKAMEFSQAAQKKAGLEDELKSTTQYIKSQITEATATVNRISQELGRGKYSESVRCHWVMNEPSRGQKTLYRLDREPKEPVESTRMTASDKQLELEDIAARAGKTERTLEEKPITPITNQPYEGEMLSDAEVEKETGLNPSELNGDSEDGSDEDADAADNCPI